MTTAADPRRVVDATRSWLGTPYHDNANRLGDAIDEAVCGRLLGVEPGLLAHQLGDVRGGAAGLPHEALARDEHLACDHRLEAVEVRQAVGVRFVSPCEPQPLDLVTQSRNADQR